MTASRAHIIDELLETIDVAKRSMHGHMQMVVEGHSISRTQLELLFTVQHLQPTTAKEIAIMLNLTAGAISQLLDELTNQNLVDREADPADRRKHVIRISDAGNDIMKGLTKRRHDVMQKVIVNLSDEELKTWLKIQKQIIDVFQELHHNKTSDMSITERK